MSRIDRVYIGNLPDNVTKDELYDFCEKYGRVLDVDIKYGKTSNNTAYAFVTFRDEEDARECIKRRDGAKFADLRVRVEPAGGRRRQTNDRGPPRRSDYRLYITGLPRGGASWQDLKDHFRSCGDVGYANVEGDVGVVEFHEKNAMLDARDKMKDVDFRGQHGDCKIEISTEAPSGFEMRSYPPPREYGNRSYGGGYGDRGGGGGYGGRRRSDSRDGGRDSYRGRDNRGGGSRDRYGGDRGGGDRYGGGGRGGDRSRSPPRREDGRESEATDRHRSRSRGRRSVSPDDRDRVRETKQRSRSRSASGEKRRSASPKRSPAARRSRSASPRSRSNSPRK